MHFPTPQALIAVTIAGCLTHGLAAGPPIGIAMANGPFRVDQSEVKGNASLFDGSEVATGAASSKLRINSGARLEVAIESRAKVFATRAVLEKGAGQVEGLPAYVLEARTLRIHANSAHAIARVSLDGSSAVVVSAFNGPGRVSTDAGVMVATLAAGRSLSFQTQAATPNAFEITGCLLKKNGRFVVVDQTTGQLFELSGPDMSSDLGNRVTVKGRTATGGTAMEGAAQLISVRSVTQVAPGGCLATAASVNADPPPGATPTGSQPPAVTQSHGPNKAVIAGVIVAGAAGVGIALGVSGKSKSQ